MSKSTWEFHRYKAYDRGGTGPWVGYWLGRGGGKLKAFKHEQYGMITDWQNWDDDVERMRRGQRPKTYV